MIAHLLASSCFPNCHPPGVAYSGVQQSGTAALGAAAVCAVLLLFGRRKGGGK